MRKVYYYSLDDINVPLGNILYPYSSTDLKSTVEDFVANPTLTAYPYALNNTILEELYQRVVARYYDSPLLKFEVDINEDEPSSSEIGEEFGKWLLKFLNFVAQTGEYYMTILNIYENEKQNLMDDITATSNNKVKFNDTPQNPNTLDVYEGDNYITNFTSTVGETSSPLMSKIMRLKEIQDNFRNIMGDWVNDCEKLFIEGGNL